MVGCAVLGTALDWKVTRFKASDLVGGFYGKSRSGRTRLGIEKWKERERGQNEIKEREPGVKRGCIWMRSCRLV